MTTTLDSLLITLVVLVGLIAFLTFKIAQFIRKAEKLYDYFIRSESEIDTFYKELESTQKPLPPMNGECPTKEELENL